MNIGDKLINFKLQATNGEYYSNFDFADRYALCIIFMGNTCDTAKSYWDRILKLYDNYEEDNLAIIAINSNHDDIVKGESLNEMKELVKDLNHEGFVYLKDTDQSVAKEMGASKIPEVFLFNSRRELVYKGIVDDSPENSSQVMMAYLEDAIEYCLDGLDIDYPELPAVGCDIEFKN